MVSKVIYGVWWFLGGFWVLRQLFSMGFSYQVAVSICSYGVLLLCGGDFFSLVKEAV